MSRSVNGIFFNKAKVIKICILIGVLLVFNSCEEIYEFDIESNEQILIVEGFISDKSYNDTKAYPSDGRLFSIKLKWSSKVTNQHDAVVTGASITLLDNEGMSISYEESSDLPGTYQILDPNFSATSGREYLLRISLENGDVYESEIEKMVEEQIPQMGDICFEEVEKKVYRWRIDEFVVDEEKGLEICIDLPVNLNDKAIYYRWNFDPTWIFIAPLASIIQPDYRCWATNHLYLSSYSLKKDDVGGYKNDILYMSLFRNERIFEKMSVLVIQQAMTERYHRFWSEMYDQSQRGGLFDAPPFNLDSNFKQIGDGNKKVSGYFGVVKESAVRWHFSKNDLSYYLEDYLKRDCTTYGLDPGPDCFSCLAYTKGTATLEKPTWWE